MRPQPKQREPFTTKRLLTLAVAVVVGMFLGWALGRVSSSSLGPLAFLSFFATGIFVHELGHAMAALMVHFQVQSFTVGPLLLHREAAGLRLRRTRVNFAGLVTIVPVGLND